MAYRKDQPEGLTFTIRSPDDMLRKAEWEAAEYFRIAATQPQDWRGMVYMFINACITLTGMVDWYAKALKISEPTLRAEAETAVDGLAICRAIANTTKHGAYRSSTAPSAAVGLGRTMSAEEMTMSIEDLLEYQDNTVFHDWKVSVQTGRGQFYGDQFLEHVAAGLVTFAAGKGLVQASAGLRETPTNETVEDR